MNLYVRILHQSKEWKMLLFYYFRKNLKLYFNLIKGNLPDPGKAQDFMKKFTQVLEDDEKKYK